jgi:threonine/homoserine/homoserine lactone efflux protein
VLTALVAFLGVSALVICTPGQDTALTIRNTLSGGRASGFATAAGVALGNPKMAAFFTSLLPQFGDGFAVLLGLGLLFSLMTLVWLSAYALAVARTSAFLLRPRVRRASDAITGAVLVALGVRLATSR